MKRASPWSRLSLAAGLAAGGVSSMTARTGPTMETVEHLKDFPVIELRRYTIKAGERQNFADYFESFFPEAFEQIGAIAFGQFLERSDSSRFTWLRGFHTLDDRAAVNGAFYDGPLWKEHRATMNGILDDSDNVLLLRPLEPGGGIPVLPAVDPVRQPRGARGVVAAQIFAVKAGAVDAFAREVQGTFAGYLGAGAREAGLLATLDVPNNFPRLPIRTDGPFLVWLGIFEDDRALEKVEPLVKKSANDLSGTGLLRGAPEWIVLEPTRRSRLRWLALPGPSEATR
jgi:hypothetical protein